MKKEMIIAIAAGVAVTGLAFFLFGTETGKKWRRNIKINGTGLNSKFEGLINTGKQRLDSFKAEMLKETDSKEVVA
jgi:hypothetical protein